MRIAYVCADPGVRPGARKGAAVHLEEFSRALGRRGAEVTLVVVDADRPVDGLRVRTVGPAPPSADAPPSGAAEEVEREQVRRGPLFEAVLDEEHARAPFDAVVERLSLFSLAGLRFARKRGLPFALEMNAPLAEEQAAWRTLAFADLARQVERTLLLESDLLVLVSEPLRERALSAGAAPERALVLPNGVDPGRFHPGVSGDAVRKRFGLDGSFVVGFFGSLRPWHALPFLFEAAWRASIGDLRFLVVGEGPEGERARSHAASLGLPAVFTGWIPHEEVPAHLAACDAVAAPYAAVDPFYFSPLKVVEAMAVGRALLAPDVPALRSLVRHGETGLLYVPLDAGSCAAALRRLRADGDLRRRLGERASVETLAERTWDRIASVVLERLAAAARNPSAV